MCEKISYSEAVRALLYHRSILPFADFAKSYFDCHTLARRQANPHRAGQPFPLPFAPADGILWGMGNDERKIKQRDTLKENAGKLLVDLAKLIFGAIVLGSILQGELPRVILLVGGFIAAILISVVGLQWMSKGKGG
ncbi:MAG: hypothetical protein FWB78_07235 [Treponema sp.]|nr:hypothetical protein [Treponema sp.]